MGSISTAVSIDRVSSILGYAQEATLEGVGLGFLPQSGIVLAAADEAHESSASALFNFTSAKEVGDEFGYGSMAYQAARIIRPVTGNSIGGIPTKILKVAKPAGGVAKIMNFTITGTATGTATHTLKVNGRTSLDGNSYSFVVNKDDTNTEIAVSMANAMNSVLGCTLTGSVDVSDNLVATAKSAGLFTDEYNVEVLTNGNAVGITYAEIAGTSGAGAPSVGTPLELIGNEWVTQLVNGYGSDNDVLVALEDFNGDANTKSGRYTSTVFKPLVAYFGDNRVAYLEETEAGVSKDGATEITDTPTGRKEEMTNVFSPAPNSKGTSVEAAANMFTVYAPIAQSTPHESVIGYKYPDMPIDIDTNIGDFADDNKRDQIVKIGSSTVKVNSGLYEIVDMVTTYHPDNEPVTSVSYRWVRNLVGLNFNYRYSYKLLEEIYVVGKTILGDDDITSVSNVIKPKIWKGILITEYATSLIDNALMTDLAYFISKLETQVGESNATRLETSMGMKETSTARVLSTTVQTTLNFG